MSDKIVCSVVVPLYNEEEVILETYKRLKRFWTLPMNLMKLYLLMMEVEIKPKKWLTRYVTMTLKLN